MELGADVQILEDGGFILLGSTESFGNGGSDIWLIKTDSEGEITWTKTFGDNSSDYGKSILKTPDDGYIIRGVTESFGYGNTTLVLIKIDSTGNKIWDNAFGGSDGEDGNALEETNDGGHILICHSYVHESSAYDIRLIKIDRYVIAFLVLFLAGVGVGVWSEYKMLKLKKNKMYLYCSIAGTLLVFIFLYYIHSFAAKLRHS